MRRRLRIRRVGHTGTLDPFASGLLLVLVGRATRLAQFVVGLEKTYSGSIVLGMTTETDDREGAVLAESDHWRNLTDGDVASAMRRLEGTIQQEPPAFSAKKVAGKRAHRLARAGTPPALAAVSVTVREFAFQGRRENEVQFVTSVGSGTYVRALARDLGRALECGAHLKSLRRTSVGSFMVRDSHAPECSGVEMLRPMSQLLGHLQQVELSAEHLARVRHGQAIPEAHETGGPVAMTAGGRLVGVAEADGDVLRPRVVLEP